MVAADNQPRWVARLDELHLLTPLRVLLIVAVAVVLTLVLKRVVHRLLRRTFVLAQRFDRDEGVRLQARQDALASSLRSALVGVIWAIAVITVVGEFDINIGAFVATATVIGGAVGFGAQTLIRDVIAGFFVLAEDQYGVGDEVDLGHASGSVERITLRTARLRDGDGRIWHVPHGNVVRVANLSKSARAAISLEVARSMPVERLHEVAEGLSAELVADPVAGPMLTDAPQVVGLTDVRDDRLVFRLVAPTSQGQHDAVRRVWRQKVLAAFADGRLQPPSAASTTVVIQPPEPAVPPDTMP